MSVEVLLVITSLCWLSGAGVLLLVIFPSWVASLREAAVAAEINRCTLFDEEVSDETFRLLQLKALIYDGCGVKDGVALRLSKLRELYLAMDDRGRTQVFGERQLEKYGRNCLHELSRIIVAEISDMRPIPRVDATIVYAREILGFVANRDREARSIGLVHKASDIEAHFRAYPLTLEQVGEMLEAVSYGLLYRKRPSVGLQDEEVTLWSNILGLERRLRLLVTQVVAAEAQTETEFLALVADCVGSDVVASAVSRSRNDGEPKGTHADGMEVGEGRWVLEYLYMDHLKQIMQRRWNLFGRHFPDKRQLNEALDSIEPVRNRLAHGRRLGSKERKLATAACLRMTAWLDVVSEDLRE